MSPKKDQGYESAFAAQLAARTNEHAGLNQLARVLEKYAHIGAAPWSFKDHEFQIEIVNDVSRRMAVQKCSQIGLSETSVQKTLAIAASMKDVAIIYSLPTRTMAQKFSNDRFDSAIRNSPYYSNLVATAKNSVEQKMIGSSMLYIAGTWGSNDAISIPATVVINDEVDFSNQDVLGKMESRLRHQEQDEHGYGGYRQLFSTPTVPDFGINGHFKVGDQKYYAVKCKCCNEWQIPDYFSQMVLPGFDRPIEELSRNHLQEDPKRVMKAKLICRKCGKCLYESGSVFDPAHRQWIAEHPGRAFSSYQIFPWDVPRYNKPSSILSQVSMYTTEEDFFNFVIGIPRVTDESMFLTSSNIREQVKTSNYIPYVEGAKAPEGEYYFGMDVGKTCHIVIEAVINGERQVVNAMTITAGDKTLRQQAMAVFEYYNPRHGCVDAGPDNSLVTDLVTFGRGKIHAVEYANRVDGLKLFTEKDPAPGEDYNRCLRADRTKLIGKVMKDHNGSHIKYPAKVIDAVFSHLKGLRRVVNSDPNSQGVKFRYQKIGEDHYAHALCYARLAGYYEEDRMSGSVSTIAMPPTVRVIKRGGRSSLSYDPFSNYR